MRKDMNKEQVLNKAEDWADQILRRGKHFLPHIARLCIVSTFVEDGLRMWFQWGNQRDYMCRLWGVHYSLGTLFVAMNLIGQLGGATLVLLRMRVNITLLILAFIVLLQTVAYNIYETPPYLMRNLALLGGLILLAAENKTEGKSLFAGLPSMGEGQGKTYMQLGGRLFLVFMFLTLVKIDWSPESIIINAIGLISALSIGVGYKTKLSSLLLIILLTGFNFYAHNWWSLPMHKASRDYKKYNFFQILSVVGGLLLVVTMGPGGYSIDEHKKRW